MKRVVVKIGSNVLTRSDGTLNVTRMSSLVDQIAELRRGEYEVILVSSGAVAAGRNQVKTTRKLDTVSARQLFSAVGQAKLINLYYELFREHGLICGQILTTKEGFGSRLHYLTQKHCMETMLSQGVIPIINENDTVSVTELMFTDNDELAALVAAMMDAEKLVILSNIDGLYDGDPKNPDSKIIKVVDESVSDLSSVIVASRSSFGRGGMITKSRMAIKAASEGIEVVIANGTKEGILPRVLLDGDAVCTRFTPHARLNSVRKWIAHSMDFTKGSIVVNETAAEMLLDPDKATSLLPVGIVSAEGDFVKGDLVDVLSADGRRIGLGCSEYSSAELAKVIGEKGKRPAIHYDYLYTES